MPKNAKEIVDKIRALADSVAKRADSVAKRADSLIANVRILQTYQDAHNVIVIATLFDQSLERALLSKMRPLNASLRKNIFNNYGAMLSTFSAKIDMAYALDILPKQIYDDLKTMNNIRNRFAHAADIRTFAHPEIAVLLDKISGMDAAIINVSRRFLKRMVEIDAHIEAVANPGGE